MKDRKVVFVTEGKDAKTIADCDRMARSNPV
jgi:hypothetical protein